MKRLLLLACVLALLVVVPVAHAAKITVSAVAAGSTLNLTICGTGARTVEVRVFDPNGNMDFGQAYSDFECFDWNGWAAPVPGEYTVEIGNLNHKNTFASTTVTVP